VIATTHRNGLRFELLLFALAAGCFTVGSASSVWAPVPFEPGTRAAGVLRILTWNVGQSNASLASEDVAHVAAVIRELDPDLCFLQEMANTSQLGKLQRELGPDWSHSSSRARGGSQLAVLARGAKLVPFRVPAPGAVAHGVRCRTASRRTLSAVGLHADTFSSRRRNHQIGSTVDFLLRRHPNTPKIVAGDLNLDLDLGKRRDLFSDDSYRDVETYNYVAERLTDTASGRGSTAEPDRRLDYIFVSPEHFALVAAGPVRGRRHGHMDHDPVVADVRFR
jgi:endonuclease/exonuclease/phosphatase family metal-dependent hydrolase